MPETPWIVKDIAGLDEFYFESHSVYISHHGVEILRVVSVGYSTMDDYTILYCCRLNEHWCSIGINRHESTPLLHSVKEG